MMFQKVEGETAILVDRGVYRQVDVYVRDGGLYARFGTGFIRLYADGSTSHPYSRLETLAYDGPLYRDRLGRLTQKGGEGHRAITVADDGRLRIEAK